jgi:hypothetical protein
MRLIMGEDDELFVAVSMASRLGRAERLLERMEEHCRKDPEDPEAAFRYALGLLAVLPATGSELAAYGRFGAAADALTRVVAAVPDHWLARFLRIRLRCLLAAQREALREPAETELSAADTEVDQLIDLQSRGEWQPYFASTYLLAARLAAWPARPGRDPQRAAAMRVLANRAPAHRPTFHGLSALLNDAVVDARERPQPPAPRLAAERTDPSAETVAQEAVPAETASSLARFTDYLRALVCAFDELPDSFASPYGGSFAAAKFDLEDIRRMAGRLRDELGSWSAGDPGAVGRTRAAIPGMRIGLQGFLAYCLTTADAADGLDVLGDDAATRLRREMRAAHDLAENIIVLLARCEERASATRSG